MTDEAKRYAQLGDEFAKHDAVDGFVTATMARFDSMGKMAHDDLVCPPPVPASDHPARRLALCPFHTQLSRR
jgi:hypothetical protein